MTIFDDQFSEICWKAADSWLTCVFNSWKREKFHLFPRPWPWSCSPWWGCWWSSRCPAPRWSGWRGCIALWKVATGWTPSKPCCCHLSWKCFVFSNRLFTWTLPWHRQTTQQHSRCLGMPGSAIRLMLKGGHIFTWSSYSVTEAKSGSKGLEEQGISKGIFTSYKVPVPVLHSGFLAEWMQEFSIAGQEARTIGTNSPVLFAKPKLHGEPIQLWDSIKLPVCVLYLPSPTSQSPDQLPPERRGQCPVRNVSRMSWDCWKKPARIGQSWGRQRSERDQSARAGCPWTGEGSHWIRFSELKFSFRKITHGSGE